MKKNTKWIIVLLGAILAAAVIAIMCLNMAEKKAGIKAMKEGQQEIYFAGGCFWGIEKYFSCIEGVLSTDVGYANSEVEDPTYEEVCYGKTHAVETVRVVYDAQQAPLTFLLKMYYNVIDPTAVNRQGNDIGVQYRSGIYFTQEAEKEVIEQSLKELSQKYYDKIEIECLPLDNYYSAETYHQQYLEKNPGGYCHIDLGAFEKAKNAHPDKQAVTKTYFQKSDEELKKTLTKKQYEVTRENETELPFTNDYWDNFETGIYVDITTGEPLFVSSDKAESGCGWPSFTKPINREVLEQHLDITHGLVRTEVRSKTGNAHLGHVFEDGSRAEGGLRYCINSAALRFIPVSEMEKEGYGDYISRVSR